jgi:hypothetical protein
LKPTELKLKTCRICKEKFAPRNTIQPTCWKFECQVEYAARHQEKVEALREKRERQALREAKERIRPRSYYVKLAQQWFNRFIKLRDKAAGYPCISSGRPLDWTGNKVDAGHYRSVGSAPHLRFDERNCHAQSKHDNRYKSGNAVDYRIGLIARRGLEEVEDVEADQTPRHYSIPDLKQLIAYYKGMCKELLTKGE